MTYHAKVIAGGKIVIPAELHREFGIQDRCGAGLATPDCRSAIALVWRWPSIAACRSLPAIDDGLMPISISASTSA